MGAPSKIRGRRATPGPGRRLAPRKTTRKNSGSRSDSSISSDDVEYSPDPAAAALSAATLASSTAVDAGSASAGPASSSSATSVHRSRSRRARSLPRQLSLQRVTHWCPAPPLPPSDPLLFGGCNDEVDMLRKETRLLSVEPSWSPPVATKTSLVASKPGAILSLKPSLKKNDSTVRFRDSARRIRFVLNADPNEGHVRPTRLRRGSPFRGRRASSGSSSDGRGDDRRTASWRRPKNAFYGADSRRPPSRSPSRSPSPPLMMSSPTPPRIESPTHIHVRPHCSNVLHPKAGAENLN